MQQNSIQDSISRYQDELKKALSEILFDNTNLGRAIPGDFAHWLRKALEYETPRSLDCDWSTFRKLLTAEPAALNLYDMSFAIHAITWRSINEMGMTRERYISVIDDVEFMAKKWNQAVMPIKTQVEKRIQSSRTLTLPNKR